MRVQRGIVPSLLILGLAGPAYGVDVLRCARFLANNVFRTQYIESEVPNLDFASDRTLLRELMENVSVAFRSFAAISSLTDPSLIRISYRFTGNIVPVNSSPEAFDWGS